MTIYVGNLAYTATVDGLKELFCDNHSHCVITKVIIPTDRETGRPRGFAFIEMENESHEDEVCLHYENRVLEYLDRELKINKAKPKEEGSSGGGSFGSRPPRPRTSFGGSGDRPQRSGNGGGYGGGSGGSRPGSGSGERRSSFGGSSSGRSSDGKPPRRNNYEG